LPVANKANITWTMEALLGRSVERIIIVTHYRGDQIRYVLKGYDRVAYLDQKAGAGTAPATLSAWEDIDDDQVLVIYGDVRVTEEDIGSLLEASAGSGAMVSALMQPLGQELPNDWMCAQVAGESIECVLGHPRDGVSHRFCGVFVLDKRFRTYLEHNPGTMQAVQVAMMSPDEAHIEDSIQSALNDHHQVQAVGAKGVFVDIDKPWHLLEANDAWLRHLSAGLEKDRVGAKSKISDGATIEGRIVVGDHCVIGPGVYIEGDLWLGDHSKIVQGAIVEPRVSIGSHCLVRRYAQIEEGTSIGDEGLVGHCAEVAGVFFRKAWAYHYGEYWGVVGECSDLGAATVCGNLRFDDLQTTHRIKGRLERPRTGANAVYIGDYVRTGVNAIIMPGVKVGPYSVLGAGTIVHQDVPDRTLLYVAQEHVQKTWGPERYGW
jgi:bifunctional UDP-N-acetylglucosamine pyrophosphorylase/glucosamine-1-phosphate N-acetyltransferase